MPYRNKEKGLAHARQYYAEHKEEKLALAKEYYKKRGRKRRILLFNNPSGKQYMWYRNGTPYMFYKGRKRVLDEMAEKILGKKLKRNEIVHHINGNTLDNRCANLLVCTKKYHGYLHQELGRRWMKENLGGANWAV